MNKQQIGKIGEEEAIRVLRKNKYKIIDRNIRFGKLGEIDIVAQQKKDIVFIEVKTKKTEEFGSPFDMIDYYKKQKLIKLAYLYITKNKPKNKNFRFDIVGVELDNEDKIKNITIIKNAIEEE